MERHVDLLGILASLWGALSMLIGVSMLLLSLGAVVQVFAPAAPTMVVAAGVTAGFFAVIGIFALLWGGAHVWGALLLRRRHPLGRVLNLALAVVNLLIIPPGTALGIYALWVLLTNEGRRLFEAPAPANAR